MYYDLLTRFLLKPQDPRESHASCRKYESTSNCLTLAAATPDRISLVKSTTTFADILTCAVFFISWGAAAAAAAAQQASLSQISPKKLLDDRRANRQWSSRLFELSPRSSTKPDNILGLFKHFSVCHHLSARSQLLCAQKEERGTLFILFQKLLPSASKDGNPPLLCTAASLLMHLSVRDPVCVYDWTKLLWWSPTVWLIWRITGEQRRGADWAV